MKVSHSPRTVFSSRLKDVLNAKGLTQSWLSEQTGVTQATISRYMTNEFTPSLGIIIKLSQALNVSVDYLIGTSLVPTLAKELPEDIHVLVNAYRRLDDNHKNIIWATMNHCLTSTEKDLVAKHRTYESQEEFVAS